MSMVYDTAQNYSSLPKSAVFVLFTDSLPVRGDGCCLQLSGMSNNTVLHGQVGVLVRQVLQEVGQPLYKRQIVID